MALVVSVPVVVVTVVPHTSFLALQHARIGSAHKKGRWTATTPLAAAKRTKEQHMASAPFGARLKLLPLWFKDHTVQVGGSRGGRLDARASLRLSKRELQHSRKVHLISKKLGSDSLPFGARTSEFFDPLSYR